MREDLAALQVCIEIFVKAARTQELVEPVADNSRINNTFFRGKEIKYFDSSGEVLRVSLHRIFALKQLKTLPQSSINISNHLPIVHNWVPVGGLKFTHLSFTSTKLL